MGDLQMVSQEMDNSKQVIGKRFRIRLFAYLFDGLMLVFVSNAIQFIGGYDFYFGTFFTKLVDDFVALLLITAYFALFEWLYGATLGKVILGMRVVQEDGERCSLGTAVARGLWRYWDGILFGVVALATMEPPLYQRHGDKSAKTIVVAVNAPIIKEVRKWWWFFVALGLYSALYFVVTWLMMAISV